MENSFVNPYHFVPLADYRRSSGEAEGELLTGKLRVRIETRTPLFIPNTGNKNTVFREVENRVKGASVPEGHHSYDFFSYTQKDGDLTDEFFEPVIPGSEIRGMIRNIYETVTGSCMSAVDDDVQIVKRVGDPYSPGLIRREADGSMKLYSARRYRLRSDEIQCEDGLEEGEKVYFQPEEHEVLNKHNVKVTVYDARNVRRKGPGTVGYVLRGECGVTKKHDGVFMLLEGGKDEKGNKKKEKRIDPVPLCGETHIRMFETVLKSYQDDKVNKNLKEKEQDKRHYGYRDYARKWAAFKRGEGEAYFPVYYWMNKNTQSQEEKILYLSPACMTKEAYRNRLSQILKAQGNFQSCTDSAEMCPACALFGMTGKSSRASGLRFADARLIDKASDYRTHYRKPVVLEELAQPKIAAAEFYLKKPDENADFWTYDYYVAGGKIVEYLPSIAGRKFYWHNMQISFKDNVATTERNRTVRPLRKGISFEEEVYFDQITEKQLRQLIAILDVSRSGEMGYKLGAAKPLGLDSVAMTVEEVRLRRVSLCDGGVRYEETPYPVEASFSDWEELDFTPETREAFLRMMRFDATERMTVTYPVTEDQLRAIRKNGQLREGFKWFVANHGGGRVKKRENSKYEKYFQSAAQDDISLTALRLEKKESSSRTGREGGSGGRKSREGKGYGGNPQSSGGNRQGSGQNRQGFGGNRQGSGSNRQGYGGNRQSYGPDRQRSGSNRYDNSGQRRNDGGKTGNGRRWSDSDKKNY